MQGVIKSYDPGTGDGVVLCDTDLREYDLAPDALQGSVFRMLRQGQRVIFDVDAATRATRLRLGSDRKSTRLELQSLMRISYAVFCLKKTRTKHRQKNTKQ